MTIRLARMKQSRLRSILRRDNSLVPFDVQRIYGAILKALHATNEGTEQNAEILAKLVCDHLFARISSKPKTYIPSVEEVQDIVEYELSDAGFGVTSSAYRTYRKERARARSAAAAISPKERARIRESEQYFKNPISLYLFYKQFAKEKSNGIYETVMEYSARTLDTFLGEKKALLSEKEYTQYIHMLCRQDIILPADMIQARNSCISTGLLATQYLKNEYVDQVLFLVDMVRYGTVLWDEKKRVFSGKEDPFYPYLVLVRSYDTKKRIQDKISRCISLAFLVDSSGDSISVPVYGYAQSRYLQDDDYIKSLEIELSRRHKKEVLVFCVFSHNTLSRIPYTWEHDAPHHSPYTMDRDTKDAAFSAITRKDFLAMIHIHERALTFFIASSLSSSMLFTSSSLRDQMDHFVRLYQRVASKEVLLQQFLFPVFIIKSEWIDFAAYLYAHPEFIPHCICIPRE